MSHVIGIVLHPTRDSTDSLRLIERWASAYNLKLVAREVDRERVPAATVLTDDEFRAQVGAVISLGGDGTLLGAMRLVAADPVPVLGVNHGHLGFLVELDPSDLEEALRRIKENDFAVEEQSCLRITDGLPGLDEHSRVAFNDVVFAHRGGPAVVSLDLTINGVRYGYYRSDALIVSTPAGSTAYNYAAGGPVLSPSAQAVVISPVAPMAGIGRPVVLGASDVIHLHLAPDDDVVDVEIDGMHVGQLRGDDRITLTTDPHGGQVVRFDQERYAEISRVKLSLLDLPLRHDQLLELIPAELRDHTAEL